LTVGIRLVMNSMASLPQKKNGNPDDCGFPFGGLGLGGLI